MVPAEWRWTPFETPRHRFDPKSGRFRARYAANRPTACARERFSSRTITERDGDLWIVMLTGGPRALHLTRQSNLDALGLDDRVNTGRIDEAVAGDALLETCQALSDAVFDWWGRAPPPIVYRTRTLPSARSMAFTHGVTWHATRAHRLRDAVGLHATLVARHGFTVPDDWLDDR